MITGPTLPLDYQIPNIGEYDPAMPPMGIPHEYCAFLFLGNDRPLGSLQWVCTLPKGHWGGFHVAHVGNRVVGVYPDPSPVWLRLQDGL